MTSEETWVERIVAWRASGLSAAEYCKEQDYDTSALRMWSSRLGRAGKVPRSPSGRRPRKTEQPAQPPPVSFARVVTKAEGAQLPTVNEPPAQPSALVVVIGHARLEVAAGFDPVLLRSIVCALAAGAP